MSTPVRLVAFAVVVLLGLGGGFAVGAAVGPIDAPQPSMHDAGHQPSEHGS